MSIMLLAIITLQLKTASKGKIIYAQDKIINETVQPSSLSARIANFRTVQAIKKSFNDLQTKNNVKITDYTNPNKPVIKTDSSAKTIINAIHAPFHAAEKALSSKINSTIDINTEIEKTEKRVEATCNTFKKITEESPIIENPTTATEDLQNLTNKNKIDKAELEYEQAKFDLIKLELEKLQQEQKQSRWQSNASEINQKKADLKDTENSLLNAKIRVANSYATLKEYDLYQHKQTLSINRKYHNQNIETQKALFIATKLELQQAKKSNNKEQIKSKNQEVTRIKQKLNNARKDYLKTFIPKPIKKAATSLTDKVLAQQIKSKMKELEKYNYSYNDKNSLREITRQYNYAKTNLELKQLQFKVENNNYARTKTEEERTLALPAYKKSSSELTAAQTAMRNAETAYITIKKSNPDIITKTITTLKTTVLPKKKNRVIG